MDTGVVGEMRGVVEWLRIFVEQHGWDYCVVWKLSDDPSRFVEFVDCCCAGGFVQWEKSGDEIGVMPVCRDIHIAHPIHTRACETLAKIPTTMSLYSGIHTEVAMANEPMWLSEDGETLVLIPLGGGLIELFAAKHVNKDQTMLEFIQYQFNISLERDALQNHLNPIVDEVPHQETGVGNCLQNSSPAVLFTATIPRKQSPVKGIQTRSCFPGSSTGSNPSNPSIDSASGRFSRDLSLPASLNNSPCSKKTKLSEKGKFSKQQAEAASSQLNAASELGNPKLAHTPVKEVSKAKNLEVERKRRSRIKDGEFQLRALVPNISKMDRASIIGDAINYVIELKKTVQDLEEELKKNDDHDENVDQGGQCGSKLKSQFKIKNSEVQVEVLEVCERNFLLRIQAEQQPCGFSRLMKAVRSRGLQVEDFHITSCHGLVLSSFRVEANIKVQLGEFKESLIKEVSAAARQ
ncbi:unnamed protein product [Rhodiola kirilowii]